MPKLPASGLSSIKTDPASSAVDVKSSKSSGLATDIDLPFRAAELNRQILLSAQEGIVVFDRQLRYVLWNPYMERMTGVKESEVVGKHPLSAFPMLATNGMYDDLQKALAGETVTVAPRDTYFTAPQRSESGWCNYNFAPLRGSAGEIAGVVATVRDVTERKRTVDRMTASEALLAQAEQLANLGSWEVELETQVLYWSAQFHRMLGFDPRPDPVQHSLGIERIHPDDRERGIRDMEALNTKGVPLDNELRFVRSDGAVRVFHSRAIAIADSKGRPVRVQGMSQDVTERKREEEQLRNSEALLSQAEQVGDFGSWEYNLKTGRTTLSKNLLQIYGLASEADWDREVFWKRVHPDDRRRARSQVEASFAQCKPFEHVIRYRGADGEQRVLLTRAMRIPGPDGRVERSIGVTRDITNQVHAEEELRELSSRLLRLQDEERRRIARDLHDSVSQKLLSISLNLARLEGPGNVRRKVNRGAWTETRQMVRDLSREVRSLTYLLHPPLLDELGLVSAIEEYVRGFGQRSGIRLEFDSEANIGRMSKESETAFFRILQEALGNIQKHSGSSIGRIGLRRDGNETILEISDEGRGIGSGKSGRRRPRSRALGVGILGMRERMRQLGGRLEISSCTSGTTIRAVLPLQTEDPNVSSHLAC